MSADSTRYLPGGEEAGSGPGDRPFRPDVEGLRAVAIVLVVLFHTGLPLMRSGYVGVDVFFVVSGFVITGLLLRERESSGGTAYLSFYARRARRILPAALVVIVVSLVATALLFGDRASELVASDSRWTALFLGNFRFGSVFERRTHYPSGVAPHQSVGWPWRSSFYLVYPAALALAALAGRRWSFRAVLAIGLTVVVVASCGLGAPHPIGDLQGLLRHPCAGPGSWPWAAWWRWPRRGCDGCRTGSPPSPPGAAWLPWC